MTTMANKTDGELKELANDIYRGLVFTDRNVSKQDGNLLGNVFMVLGLMNEKQNKEFWENPPGMIYEYYQKAGPRGINGYPVFFSMQRLTAEEAEKVTKTVIDLLESKKKVLNK